MPGAGERPFRSLVVLGGGIVGLSAATAFARALPQLAVTVIETPPDPAALADRLPGSHAAIHLFHERLGLPESELLRSGAATPRLALRFEHWSADGAPWFHFHGDCGLPMDSIPFHQIWARARRAGRAGPYHRYAAAGALAEAGRFAVPEGDERSPLSTYDYALRLDPERYRTILAALADHLRIARSAGEYAGIERRADGGVAALRLADGLRLEADLFLDCAGPAAPLLSALDDRFEEWSESLPGDRLLFGRAPGGEPTATDLVAALGAGWRFAGGPFAGFVHASGVTGEGKARQAFASAGGVREAELVAIRPGRRPEPWQRNVLALGDAAIAVDPLHWTNLHHAQVAILRALELLPGRDCHPLELAEYNRRIGQETGRWRDFLALHYLQGPRRGDFWAEARRAAVPPELARTLQLFARRGRLPFYEDDVAKEDWLAALLGLGLLPEHIDPVAAGADPAAAEAGMARLAVRFAELPAQLPPYSEYLVRLIARAVGSDQPL